MRIGIFGGAFDPPHSEHIRIIKESVSELGLDKLIVLPSYFPPHKSQPSAPFEVRVKMLESVLYGVEKVEIDTRELYSGEKYNYTYNILGQIASENPDAELVYIIGGDSMEKFRFWKNPELIAKYARLAVIGRKGCDRVDDAVSFARKEFAADIILTGIEGEEASSSVIKAELSLGITSEHLPAEVWQIVKENNLYGFYSETINNLKNDISPSLFEHCAGTVIYALRFVQKLSLDYEEVFLSALLHDCAKESSFDEEKYPLVPAKVIHQYAGADTAQARYGIENPNILDAIRYHTTGKESMTTLGKLIYCADVLEKNRSYEGVEELREIIENDFEKGFFACVEASVKKLEKEGRDIYFLTKECYNFYNNEKKEVVNNMKEKK